MLCSPKMKEYVLSIVSGIHKIVMYTLFIDVYYVYLVHRKLGGPSLTGYKPWKTDPLETRVVAMKLHSDVGMENQHAFYRCW